MTQLYLLLVLGAGFLILLYFFASRGNSRMEGGANALIEARQALNSLQTGLLPPELIARIFAREDLEFVKSVRSAEIEGAFLRERRRLALQWVGQVRKQVLNLKQFHLGESRRYAQLDLRTEMALALDFAGLLMACRILQVVFYLRGPYAAPRIVQRAVGGAGKVCGVSAQALGFLSPAGTGAFRRGSGGSPAIL